MKDKIDNALSGKFYYQANPPLLAPCQPEFVPSPAHSRENHVFEQRLSGAGENQIRKKENGRTWYC